MKTIVIALLSAGTAFSAACSTRVVGQDGVDQVLVSPVGDDVEPVNLVKVGTNKVTLIGSQTYSGATIVSNGVLCVRSRLDLPLTEDLKVWLDASDAASVSTNGMGQVTQWNSRVGSAAFGASSASYVTGLPSLSPQAVNGLPTVRFSNGGTNALEASASVRFRTLVMAVNPRTFGINRGLMGWTLNDNGLRMSRINWSSDPKDYRWGNATGGPLAGNPRINAVAENKFALNEVQVLVVTNASAQSVQLRLGCFNSETDDNHRSFDGDYAEVLVYDRILAKDELEEVENYLARKWKTGDLTPRFGGNMLPATTDLMLEVGSSFEVVGTNQTVATLSGYGSLSSPADEPGTVVVTGTSSFAGVLSGPLTLKAQGDGSDLMLNVGTGACLDSSSSGSTLGCYEGYEVPSGGLVYWLDADDYKSLSFDADGVTVTNWASRGGGCAFRKSALRAFGCPKYEPDGADGRPGVRFGDGAANWLYSSQTVKVRTLIVVAHVLGGGVNMAFWGANGTADEGIRFGYGTYLFPRANNWHFSGGDEVRLDGAVQAADPVVLPSKRTCIFTASFDDSHADPPAKYNTLGNYTEYADRNFNGYYCEVLAWSRSLSEAEIAAVEAYLAAKWQSARGLPAPSDRIFAAGATLAFTPTAGAISPLALTSPFEATGVRLAVNDTETLSGRQVLMEGPCSGEFASAALPKNWKAFLRADRLLIGPETGLMLIFR